MEQQIKALIEDAQAKLYAVTNAKIKYQKSHDKIRDLFLEKKDWGVFMQRHMRHYNRDVNPQELNCGNRVSLSFYEDEGKDYVDIAAVDWFRGESEVYETIPIPISTFIEYMADDSYLDKRKERLKSIKKAIEEKELEKMEEKQYKTYLMLKKKYEGSNSGE